MALLATISGIEIVGPVWDPVSAVVMTRDLSPAAVPLDSGPLGGQAATLVAQLEVLLPGGKHIVLADGVRQQLAAEGAGADVVLLEGCLPADLLSTVRSLLIVDVES